MADKVAEEDEVNIILSLFLYVAVVGVTTNVHPFPYSLLL